MLTFRYPENGRWYKGNTHVHSTASDGGKTFAELAQLYRAAGCDFLFRTDHWVTSAAADDPAAYPLLWLDGVELDGRDSSGAAFHAVALGTLKGIQREMGLEAAMQSARAQGALLILAHPQWTGNSFDDARRWQFDGVEVYNHVCRFLNGKGDGAAYWNAMLERSPRTLALAADDLHLNPGDPGPGGGWVMVSAAECTPEAILGALRAGQFYSSCGPVIETIACDGEFVRLTCSPVRYARLVGPAWHGMRCGSPDGGLIRAAEFRLPANWAYAYVELEDDQGRRAWTNPLPLPEAAP